MSCLFLQQTSTSHATPQARRSSYSQPRGFNRLRYCVMALRAALSVHMSSNRAEFGHVTWRKTVYGSTTLSFQNNAAAIRPEKMQCNEAAHVIYPFLGAQMCLYRAHTIGCQLEDSLSTNEILQSYSCCLSRADVRWSSYHKLRIERSHQAPTKYCTLASAISLGQALPGGCIISRTSGEITSCQ